MSLLLLLRAPPGRIIQLAAIADGVAAMSGQLAAVRALASVADGASVVAGPLTAIRGLRSAADGASTVQAVLRRIAGLRSAADGASTAPAILRAVRALRSVADGVATLIGNLSVPRLTPIIRRFRVMREDRSIEVASDVRRITIPRERRGREVDP